MGVTRYNRIFNLSLAVIVLYNILCLADIIFTLPIDGIISKSALIYIIYSVAMFCYKIHLTKRYFLGSYAIYNLIAHGVLAATSIILIIMF